MTATGRIAAAAAALLAPPTLFASIGCDAWTVGASALWAAGLVVFVALFAGPGLIMMTGAGMIGATVALRRRPRESRR